MAPIKKLAKKVLVAQGNIAEIGQLLTNIYGQNEDIIVHEIISSQGVRQRPATVISGISNDNQAYLEPVTQLFIVYSLDGELQGVPRSPEPVKANLTN